MATQFLTINDAVRAVIDEYCTANGIQEEKVPAYSSDAAVSLRQLTELLSPGIQIFGQYETVPDALFECLTSAIEAKPVSPIPMDLDNPEDDNPAPLL